MKTEPSEDWRIVKVDETRYCSEALAREKKIKEIGVYYFYDASRRVHCCELTPSYELWATEPYAVFTEDVPDEWREDVDSDLRQSMNDHDVVYVHRVTGFEQGYRGALPDREDGQDDEAYYMACVEAIREDLAGNSPCF
jgi:hypothetical protein